MKVVTKDGIPIGIKAETAKEQEQLNAEMVAAADFEQWLRGKLGEPIAGEGRTSS